MRRWMGAGGLLALSLAGGCQPEVSLQGDVWIPKWVEGFELSKLHVYLDVAPDKLSLNNLESEGIASAPVGHQSGISIHPRYFAGYEPTFALEPEPRNIHYFFLVKQPTAFVALRFWIDMNDNGVVDTGDLEGRPRGRVMEALEPSFFSCSAAGAEGDPIIWQMLEG